MAALSAYVDRRFRPGGFSWHQNWPVANSDVIYIGSFCGMPGSQGYTSRRGYATTWSNIATLEWLGVAIRTSDESSADRDGNKVTGATSNSPNPTVWTEAGPIVLEQYSVSGVSAQSDVGKAVYATNDNDLQLTVINSPIIGRVVYFYSATSVDVLTYGYLGSMVI